MRQQALMRWTGIFGVLPLVALTPTLFFGHYFYYPSDNASGRVYLDYALPHHSGQVSALLCAASAMALVMFVVFLAWAYVRLEGQTGLPSIVMIVGAAIYGAAYIVWVGMYESIMLMARGYPGFGGSASDLRLVTFAWGTMESIYTLSMPVQGVVWIAIAIANRRQALLPWALGYWGAIAVAVINFVPLASTFVYTGLWSPASPAVGDTEAFLTFLWATIAGVVLLRRRADRHPVPRPTSVLEQSRVLGQSRGSG
jgi:hypothetical protein